MGWVVGCRPIFCLKALGHPDVPAGPVLYRLESYRPHQSGIVEPAAPVIEVPATVSVQRHEWRYPRSFAERAYSDLRRFSVMPRGGHFAAAEEPLLVADDLRYLMALTS
jgi:hypothetical protein